MAERSKAPTFLSWTRSDQVSGAHVNEIKHDHSPVVIVVVDSRYD